jgi:transcriptional regulator GlxA family with amidase domain
MREARNLLVSTTLPISEVGQASGFPDPYQFSKLFRRTVGMPPSGYRQFKSPYPCRPGPPPTLGRRAAPAGFF